MFFSHIQIVDESKAMKPFDTDRYFAETEIQIEISTLIKCKHTKY